MKKTYLFILSSLILSFFISCSDEEGQTAPPPSQVKELNAEPIVGGVKLTWTTPPDSNFFFLQARYNKKDFTAKHNASIFADSLIISGLLNKHEYQFDVQTFNDDQVGSEVKSTEKIRPIRRPLDITYSLKDSVGIPLTPEMLELYTVEPYTEPNKEHLLDGDLNTIWHTTWSDPSRIEPLPHWIKITFDEPTKLGGFTYYNRQGDGRVNDSPTQFDLQLSEDGENWETVWVSEDDLPVENFTEEHLCEFDKNYESRFFKIRILKTRNMNTFTHLSEFRV
ncbi:MAG: discoidin domain-containing protein, partial [Marinilabilia sp.]